MTTPLFILLLVLLLIATIVIGETILKHRLAKGEFDESVIFMRDLIQSSELSETAFRNILDAFREFDAIPYRNEVAFRELVMEFRAKYNGFMPDDPM